MEFYQLENNLNQAQSIYLLSHLIMLGIFACSNLQAAADAARWKSHKIPFNNFKT